MLWPQRHDREVLAAAAALSPTVDTLWANEQAR
jgi:hypothetical protein